MTPVLLVATATQWLGTARIPGALANAGFAVSMLAPRGSLAGKSRFVSTFEHLPDRATPMQWVDALAAMVASTRPRVVLPCDDMAFRLLQAMVLSAPDALSPAPRLELATLIRNSLGNPAFYRVSVEKTLLPGAAEALGVRVPPYVVVSNREEAQRFAAQQGYPVVLKRNFGFAGQGVRVAADAGELVGAVAELVSVASEFGSELAPRLLVQTFIVGRVVLHSVAAWRGSLLAAYAREKLIAHPPPKGPTTVARCFHAPEVRAASRRLVEGFGMTGLFGVEYIVDDVTGDVHLLEINRRMTNGVPAGALIDVDLCAAFHAAVTGNPRSSRQDLAPGEEHVIAHFPQEWLRDPESRYLRDHRVDVPWNDPALFEAMLELRHD